MRISVWIPLLTTLVTSACGYHLRGAYDLPKGMQSVFLEGGSALFREQLNNALVSSKGQLASSPDQANVVIRVFEDDIERRALSLGSGGRSNDIELAGQLEYQILDNKNGVLVAREPIKFRREYYNDQQAVIAKGNEETVIKKEMYSQVVRTIINRGRAALETKRK